MLRIVRVTLVITLSGKGNENGKKTTIGLITKKRNVARAAHFFLYISLPFLCTLGKKVVKIGQKIEWGA